MGTGEEQPLYLRIADTLRAAIAAGDLKPGEQIPSEQALRRQFGASRETVRKAMALLRAEGRLDAQHGRGHFVRTHAAIRRVGSSRLARRNREAGKAAFLVDLEAQGGRPDVEVEVSRGLAAGDVATRLALQPGDAVLIRSRRMGVDGEPLQLAVSYLPLHIVEGSRIEEVDTGPGGTYARLEELGHRLGFFDERITVRMPSPEEIRLLHLRAGTPVICVARTAYTEDRLPVELCDTVMAGDRYELHYEIPAN
jgi:GntR family transcriptional regulator